MGRRLAKISDAIKLAQPFRNGRLLALNGFVTGFVVLVVFALNGCDARTYPPARVVVGMSPLQRAWASPAQENPHPTEQSDRKRIPYFHISLKELIPAIKPITPEEERFLTPVVDGVRKNYDSMLHRDDVAPQLDGIERVFWRTGNLLELVHYYQLFTNQAGFSNPVGHHLIWNYIRLGQLAAAERILVLELTQHPNDATLHYLIGFLKFRNAELRSHGGTVDESVIREGLKHWATVAELDPTYTGSEYGGQGSILVQSARLRRLYDLGEVPPEPPLGSTSGSPHGALTGGPHGVAAPSAPAPSPHTAPSPHMPHGSMPSPHTGTVAAAERAATVPSGAVPSSAAPQGDDLAYRVEVARGDLAASNGNMGGAVDAYRKAAELKKDHFEATFGLIRAFAQSQKAKPMVIQQLGHLQSMQLTPANRTELIQFVEKVYGAIPELDPFR